MVADDQNTFDLRIQSTYDGQGAAKAREDIRATTDEAVKSAEKVKQVNYGSLADDRASAAKAMGPSVGEEALRSEKTALLEAKRDLILAASAQDEAGIARLRAEVALRKITVDTLQTQAMTEKEIAVFSEEQAVAIQQSIAAVDARIAAEAEMLALKQAQVAAEQEQAAASALSGVNLGKARAEAMTLARELAAGSANTRTIGALLGSLGPLLAPMAVAGFVGFEWLKKQNEAAQKALEDQVKLTKDRAKAEQEWREIATQGDWQRERQKIEEKINDLLYERSTKQGEEREKIDDQIQAQEALYRKLDRIAPGLIARRDAEKEAEKATNQTLEDLEKMPKAYDLIFDKLKQQLDTEQKLEEIRDGMEVAQINRDRRDGKITNEEAARRLAKKEETKLQRENEQAAALEQGKIEKARAELIDATNRKLEAQRALEQQQPARDKAAEDLKRNEDLQNALLDAERAVEQARKQAQKETAHTESLNGKDVLVFGPDPKDQAAVDAAQAKAEAIRAQIQDSATLQENLKRETKLTEEKAQALEKAEKSEKEIYSKSLETTDQVQKEKEQREAVLKLKVEALKAESDDRVKQAEIQDREAKAAERVLKLQNEIDRIRNSIPNGQKPTPQQNAQIAALEQAKIDAEAQKQSIRRPLTPTEQDAEDLKKQKIQNSANKEDPNARQGIDANARAILDAVKGHGQKAEQDIAKAANEVLSAGPLTEALDAQKRMVALVENLQRHLNKFSQEYKALDGRISRMESVQSVARTP